jgi:FkbM family methyltransferase
MVDVRIRARSELLYDRCTRTLAAPDRASRLHARLLQAIHRVWEPVAYLGISRMFALINRLLPPGAAETVIREGEFQFRFPANDYFWNRLLDVRWKYEPELDVFFRSICGRPWLFLDLGANFGYWSLRVAALYGPRQVLAVEASSAAFRVLCRNLATSGGAVSPVHRAVWSRSGEEAPLYGSRHLGLSLEPSWRGAEPVAAERVTTVTVDDLLREWGVDATSTPLVVKVDVEGVERQVLEGASAASRGTSVFLIEDATGPGHVADAIRYAHVMGMRLYAMTVRGVRRLNGPEDVLRLKPWITRLQQSGLNLAATASPEWWRVLESEDVQDTTTPGGWPGFGAGVILRR